MPPLISLITAERVALPFSSMEINPEGKTISAEVYKGIINVRERMNYHDVQKILDKSDEKVQKRYEKYYFKTKSGYGKWQKPHV